MSYEYEAGTKTLEGSHLRRLVEPPTSGCADRWHAVTLVLHADPDDQTAFAGLRRELDLVAARVRVDGQDLSVEVPVPAMDQHAAAEIAIELVESLACRAGARLVAAHGARDAHPAGPAVAVSA